jgi:SHS2 domain-containing protein
MAGVRWRTIEHTADLGLEIEAPSLADLFMASALGMAGVLVGSEEGGLPGPVSAETATWRHLDLEAPDTEALLVEWLRELLHVQLSEGKLVAAAEIEELNDGRLVARVGLGEPGPGTEVERELKGVTYHDLAVERRNDGWFARVVFDL